MLFDRDKSLWVELIGQGIGRIPDFKHAKNVPLNRFGPKDGLSGGTVYSIYEDREGDVWFGTGGGLDRFRENKVTSYSAQEGLDPDQEIGLTSTQDGSVWIISYTRDAVRRFHDGRFLTSKLPPYSPTDTTRILSLYAEGANSVWVGGNFKLAEGIDGKFSYRYAAEIVDGANVEGVAKGADGSLWITQTRWVPEAGADSIGNILRLRNGQWTDLRQQFEFPRFRCRVVYADLQGRLWLGFENGDVAVYDSGNVRVYSTIDGLPDGRVLAISADRAGNIWVGGEGGLSELQKGHFVTLSKSNGLPGRAVSGVVEDEDGFLWLAGSLGILRVDPKELEKAVGAPSYRMQGIRFDASDGLRGLPRQHEPFPHATRAVDGRLWFATMGGVAVIDPRHWPRNSLIPPVVIEDVAADDRNYSAYSGLKLKPNIRNLEFQFTALSLMDPARVEFRYKLEGYDRDWRGPVNAREAKYTNLPPRNYRFRVIACNNDGVWNNVGATLDFSIAPAYYQTPWFLLTCMAVFLALLWALYQYRLRQVAQEFNRDLEARVSERTRIARDLHDTLLQSFQGLMLRFQTVNEMLPTRALEAKKALEGALDRADKALVEGRDAIKDMRTSTLVDYDLAQSMTALMTDLHEELATGNRDAVTFRVLVEGTPRTVAPTLRDEIYRIARESLRNAFRHAHARHIETEITYSEPLLRVRFRDDGTGIDPHVLEHGGRSGHWGLPGMRERANLIGAQLDVWSKPRAGTEVDLSIPGSIAYEEFPSRPGFRLFRNRKERNHENRS
jgi:signal transduction histidine kinase